MGPETHVTLGSVPAPGTLQRARNRVVIWKGGSEERRVLVPRRENHTSPYAKIGSVLSGSFRRLLYCFFFGGCHQGRRPDPRAHVTPLLSSPPKPPIHWGEVTALLHHLWCSHVVPGLNRTSHARGVHSPCDRLSHLLAPEQFL